MVQYHRAFDMEMTCAFVLSMEHAENFQDFRSVYENTRLCLISDLSHTMSDLL